MTIFAAIKRYLIILIAYLLSVAIAAAGVGIAFLSTGSGRWGEFVTFAGFAAILISIFAVIPAALAVLLAEFRSIRSVWYYIGFAVAAGGALGGFVGKETMLTVLGLGLGILVGMAYWLVAGRNAGILKAQETSRAQTHLLLLLASTVLIAGALILILML